MTDITMCINEVCPRRQECWRAMAPPDELWQSYARYNFAVIDGKFECPGFWPMMSRKHEKKPEPTEKDND